MDTHQSRFTGITGIAVQTMLFVLVLCITPIASAEDAKPDCELPYIKEMFGKYVNTIDQAQTTNMQDQLNTSGYGPLDTDGILGTGTRHALQRLCQDYQVKASDDFTQQMVELLAMTAAVSQKHPGWRKLIQDDAFKNWLKKQTQPDPASMNKTLQSGPADQVIAILDGYDRDRKADEKKEEPKKHKASKTRSLCLLKDDGGPMFYYRWQPPEEQAPDTDESATDPDQTDDNNELSDAILKELLAIQGKTYPNVSLFKQALPKLFTDHKIANKHEQQQILKQACNGPVEELQKIQLSGDGCGCSDDFSSLVYGFYPYWLAAKAPQVVDYSLFDRIAFYALSLDQEGKIQSSLQWGNEQDVSGFINKAHKHRVKVDITFYASGWQKWTDKAINKAAINVTKMVTKKHQSKHSNIFRAVFPFVENNSKVSADGVTLYFDDYMPSSASKNIVSLVNKVAKRLAGVRKDPESGPRLNIMLGLDIKKIRKQALFEDLASILQNEQQNNIKVDYIFTFLQDPTMETKKLLRQKIETAFHGNERRTVLRKIIPIISPIMNMKDADQFEDDLIYFQDNFAGVGLWPMPLSSDKGIEVVTEKITRLYKVKDSSNIVGEMIDEYAPWLCQFACPNRWLFRIGFDILAGLLALYALVAIWNCRLRGLYRKYALYFLAYGLVTVLVFLISMVCDPFWAARADQVMVAIFLVALVAVISRYVRRAMQPPLP